MKVTKEFVDPFVPRIYKFLRINPYLNPLCIVESIILAIMVLVQTYEFRHFTLDGIIQYSNFYFACLYSLAVNVMYIKAEYIFTEMLEQFMIDVTNLITDISHLQASTTRKINAVAKGTEFLCLTWALVTFSTVIVLSYSFTKYREYNSLFTIFLKEHIGLDALLSQIAHWIITLGTISIFIPSVSLPMYFIYLTFYLKLQFIYLTDYVVGLKKTLRIRKLEPDYVKKCIKNIAIKHFDTKRITIETTQPHRRLYVIYIGAGLLIGFMSCCLMFSGKSNLIQALALGVAYFAYAVGVCTYLQSYVNDSADLATSILDLHWYEWDVECQKMYLTLITNATRLINVSVIVLFDVDHELLKKIGRFTYAIANSFYSLRSK